MRNWKAIVWGGLLALPWGAFGGDNLLYDPGFEAPQTWSERPPPTWVIESTFQSSGSFHREGLLSIANLPHWGDPAVLSQTVPLTAEQGTHWFLFEISIRGGPDFETGDQCFELILDFLDAEQQVLSHHSTNVHQAVVSQKELWSRHVCVARSTNGAAAYVKAKVHCHGTAMGYERDNRLFMDSARLIASESSPPQLVLDCPVQLYAGHTNWIGAVLSETSPVPLVLTLSNSRPFDVSMPTQAVIAAGALSVAVPVLCTETAGVVEVYASSATGLEAYVERFLRNASFSISGPGSKYCGDPDTWTALRDGPVSGDLLASLSGAGSCLELPDSLYFPLGETAVTFNAQALCPTSATVSVQAPGYQPGSMTIFFNTPIYLLHFNPIGAGAVFRPQLFRWGPWVPITMQVCITGAVPDLVTNIDFGTTVRLKPLEFRPTCTGVISVSLSLFGVTNFTTNIVVTENLLQEAGFENHDQNTGQDGYRGYPWVSLTNAEYSSLGCFSGTAGALFQVWNTGVVSRLSQPLELCQVSSQVYYRLSLQARADPDFQADPPSAAAILHVYSGSTEVARLTRSLHEALVASPGGWIHDESLFPVTAEHTSVALELSASGFKPQGPFPGLFWDDVSLTPCSFHTNRLLVTGSEYPPAGSTQTWWITRAGGCEDSLPVQISSDNTNRVQVPEQAVFPPLSNAIPMAVTLPPQVQTAAATQVLVRVTAEGYPPVVKPVTLAGAEGVLLGPSTLAVDHPRTYLLMINARRPAPQVFSLHVAGVGLQAPATVTVPADASTVRFEMEALSTGAVVVTVSSPDYPSVVCPLNMYEVASWPSLDLYNQRPRVNCPTYDNIRYRLEASDSLSGPWTEISTQNGSPQHHLWNHQEFPLHFSTSRYFRIWSTIRQPPSPYQGYSPDMQ